MHEKFQFQNTMTMGNIFSALSIAGSVVICLLYFNSRMVVIETRIPYLERGLIDNAAATKNLSEAQAALARSMERVTVLLEERLRK